MAIECDACGVELYEVRGLAACECYPFGINAPKPATPEPSPTRNYYLEARQRMIDALNARDLTYRGTLSEEEKAELRKPATPEPPLWAPQVHQSVLSDVHRKALVEGMGTLFVGPDGEAASLDPKFWDAGGCKLGSDRLSEAAARVDGQFEAEYGSFAIEEIRRARETCQCGDVVNHSAYHSGHSPVSMYDAMVNSEVDRMMTVPAPSPLDRALSDFMAKRKAKRERAELEEFVEGAQWSQAQLDEWERRSKVARAFSLPISFTARLGMKTP